jgi:phenylalanyl-tRNA synthetase beta chain
VREALVRSGLRECISAPFVGEGELDVDLLLARPALRVVNPMRSDENLLRRSLLGPLLATARRNQERDVPSPRIFETAPVYVAGDRAGRADERLLVAGVVCGTYSDAKGCVEAVLDALGVGEAAAFEKGAPPPFSAGRSAKLRLQGAPDAAGYVGEVSPRAAARHGLSGAVAAFELSVDALAAAASFERQYTPISRFPAVVRDLAWVVAEDVPWRRVADAARDAGAPLVRSIEFLSVFRSAQMGAGRKSLAFRMELRAEDRTLTAPEADACVRSVIARLTETTAGALRA